MRNRFYVWGMHAESPREFVAGAEDATGGDEDLRYFVTVVEELDRLLPDHGLTVLLTWDVDLFEDRFDDAVVLLAFDEQYQVPSYAGRVRAVFKTGGARPNPLRDLRGVDPAVGARVALRDLRNGMTALRRRKLTRDVPRERIFEVPLGYYRRSDVPRMPFAERPTDVFFAGSIESSEGFTLRPRLVARRQMAAALEAAVQRLPGLVADRSNGGPMANPGEMLDASSYAERLARSRIALCPRGNIDETYRLMEAARSGCVLVAEKLPRRWYYAGTPAVQIPRWDVLPQVLESLLSDPVALEERGRATAAWWDSELSEASIGGFIASTLQREGLVG